MTPDGSRAEERARFEQALLDLCFERGYAALSLEDLLERASLDETAFLRHFEDLEDCLDEELEAIRADLLGRVERATAAQPCWRERIRAVGFVLWRFLLEDERVTHLAVVEARRSGARARRLLDATIASLVDLLDEGRAELEDRDTMTRADSEALAARIFDKLCALVEQGRLEEGEDAIRLLIYEAVRPYLGSDAAVQELNAPPPVLPAGS